VISYPRHADDFTCDMVRTANANPELGIYGDGPRCTWEVNTIRGRNEFVEVREGVMVPVELANDFGLDPKRRWPSTWPNRRSLRTR
jgi:hypothetical protein